MRIQFLGTAAAEGMPAVFCNCDTCKKAKQLGGKNIRTRSQILVNSDMLIDFPMDSYMHALNNGLDLSAVKYIFITHAHMDHCYPQELTLHGAPYAHNMTNSQLNIYGNKTVINRIKKITKPELKPHIKQSLVLNVLKPYDKTQLKEYSVTAVPAMHTKKENCYIYIIADGEKTYLQFNDSGILPDETFKKIADLGIKFDAISYDCTYGYYEKGLGRHMGVVDNIKQRDKMQSFGLLKSDTKHILTHFSHNGGFLYDELAEKVSGDNFIVAYDGMIVEL